MQTDWLKDLKSVDSCAGLMPTPVSCMRAQQQTGEQNEFDQSQRLTNTTRTLALRTRTDAGGSSAAAVCGRERLSSARTHRHFARELDARRIVRIGAALGGQSAAAQFDVDAANLRELS